MRASRTLDSGDRKTELNAFMLNALYNMTPMGPWQPYVGGGLGVADLNVEQIPGIDGGDFDSDYNFAYQLIGGVAYQLQSGWTLNGEVRYFGINDQDSREQRAELQVVLHDLRPALRRELPLLILAVPA